MIIKNAKVYSDGCRFVEKDLIIRDGRIVFGAAPQELSLIHISDPTRH